MDNSLDIIAPHGLLTLKLTIAVTAGLGCQGVKEGAKLEVGIRDCFDGALPWLGGSPKAARHPLPS